MNYILYGTGWEAEQLMYRFLDQDKIICVLDGKRTGTFHGYPIYTLEHCPNDLLKYKIIIAAEYESFIPIAMKLMDAGYDNFVWSKYYRGTEDRKTVAINANCHKNIYEEYLLNNDSFLEKYRYVRTPRIMDWMNLCSEEYLEVIVEKTYCDVDVYIHQDIRKQNSIAEALADDFILKRSKAKQNIVVPNMVGFGTPFFPITSNENLKTISICGSEKILFYRNCIIDALIEERGESIDLIVKKLLSPELVEKTKIQKNFHETMNKLKKREQGWDIQVYDFICHHYRKEKIFLDNSHGNDKLMKYICVKLGSILHLENSEKYEVNTKMDYAEEFTLPCVKNALGLEWDDKYIRHSKTDFTKLADGKLDVKEYVRQYVWWYYGIKSI